MVVTFVITKLYTILLIIFLTCGTFGLFFGHSGVSGDSVRRCGFSSIAIVNSSGGLGRWFFWGHHP